MIYVILLHELVAVNILLLVRNLKGYDCIIIFITLKDDHCVEKGASNLLQLL